MTIPITALIVCIVGALIYAFTTNGKLTEIGRLMFFCGLFFLVWRLAPGVHNLR